MRLTCTTIVCLSLAGSVVTCLTKNGHAFEDEILISKSALDQSGNEASSKSDHPLSPALELAHEGYQRIQREVRDYTCTMVKRERINGRLIGPEILFAKVRHTQGNEEQNSVPFSLYVRFDAPVDVQGREILFQKRGQAEDKLLVRNGGRRLPFVTLELSPTCQLAMTGNRYPITEFGIMRLVERMIELGQKELAHEECKVAIHHAVPLEDYSCTRIEVCHPVRRAHFSFHIARIYIDETIQLPVRFEAYDWPNKEGGEPILMEEYTYRDLHVNVGLTDADFSRDHADYKFRRY